MGLDSGTWPMDGGGVASCRRDVVDRLRDVRWEMIAETGNDMKTLHRSYQVEDHVLSVTFVPLWGADLGSPMQTVRAAEPVLKLKVASWELTGDIVRTYFAPLVRDLVCGCAAERLTDSDIVRCTDMFVNLHTFFQRYDWVDTWEHPATIRTWCTTWAEVAKRFDETHLRAEMPSLDEMLTTLALFTHFLMPLSVPLAAHLQVPVCHATHHGIQTLLGVVARRKCGTSLIVWDHGILWRERLRSLSNFRGFPYFARNALVGLNRMVVQVNFKNADVVVPCCATNLDWERWLISRRRGGGGSGAIVPELRDGALSRAGLVKAFPVVNGMETYRFNVNRENEAELPTAVMLSHVYELKGVKFAIRAAAAIVNDFGLTSYRLLIYGSLNKDPAYVSECRALISSNNIASNVFLKGFGNAPKVLTAGWVFVNSSLSEGLPLALGEAGLCGLPVVCTDVGGSREVLTNAIGEVFGRVVPPRDVRRLAEAQLEVFGMLGGLEGLVKSEDIASTETLDACIARGGVQGLEKRISSQMSNRRLLGMRFREHVLSNFTMSRYLREHYATLLTARSIYETRQGITSSATRVIRDKLRSGAGGIHVNTSLTMSNITGDRAIYRAIDAVEIGNKAAISFVRESGVKSQIAAAEQFEKALDAARRGADAIEGARESLRSAVDGLRQRRKNRRGSLFSSEKTTDVRANAMSKLEDVGASDGSPVDHKRLKRRTSHYNVKGDISLEELEQRSKIVEMIIERERGLALDIHKLFETFVRPLRKLSKQAKKRNRSDAGDTLSPNAARQFLEGSNAVVSTMLKTLETIRDGSAHLTKVLERILSKRSLSVTELSKSAGEAILDFAPNLAVFARFTGECAMSISHVRRCLGTDKALSAFVAGRTEKESFFGILDRCMSRSMQYKLESLDLIEHTSPFHDDYEVLCLLCEALRIAEARINKSDLRRVSQYRQSRRIRRVLSVDMGRRVYEMDMKVRLIEFVTTDKQSRSVQLNESYCLIVFKRSIMLAKITKDSRWELVVEISDFKFELNASGDLSIRSEGANFVIDALDSVSSDGEEGDTRAMSDLAEVLDVLDKEKFFWSSH